MIVITVDEFKKILNETVRAALPLESKVSTNQPHIKGTHQLAKFLGISVSKAQKLKNEGIIPCFQNERLVLFDPDKVREAMANYNHKKKSVKR